MADKKGIHKLTKNTTYLYNTITTLGKYTGYQPHNILNSKTAKTQRFQKFGVKISKTVKNSSLPTSIANDINHFAKAGRDW